MLHACILAAVAALKSTLGPQMKLRGNSEKQAVTDFITEMESCRALPTALGELFRADASATKDGIVGSLAREARSIGRARFGA